MSMLKIKKGDTVKVIAGKDKGTQTRSGTTRWVLSTLFL